MDWALFRSLLSGLILLYILYFIYIARKIRGVNYTFVLWYIKKGYNCYGCKSVIDENIELYFGDDETENFTLCKSCKREEQLAFILNTNKSKVNLFKKFIYMEKYSKLPIYLNIFVMLSLISDIFISYYTDGTRIFFYIYVLLMVLVWFYNTYRLKLSYKKNSPL